MNNIKIENVPDLINDVSSEYIIILFDGYNPLKYNSILYTYQGKIKELSNYTRERITPYLREQKINKVKIHLEISLSTKSYTERDIIVVNNALEDIKNKGNETIKYVKL